MLSREQAVKEDFIVDMIAEHRERSVENLVRWLKKNRNVLLSMDYTTFERIAINFPSSSTFAFDAKKFANLQVSARSEIRFLHSGQTSAYTTSPFTHFNSAISKQPIGQPSSRGKTNKKKKTLAQAVPNQVDRHQAHVLLDSMQISSSSAQATAHGSRGLQDAQIEQLNELVRQLRI